MRCGALVVVASLAAPICASAQTAAEVTVIGHEPKSRPGTMSYGVGYRDLDLRTTAGVEELKKRVSVAARYVCKRLGEPTSGTCYDDAIREAGPQVRKAVHVARVSHFNWKPGPSWTPPPES